MSSSAWEILRSVIRTAASSNSALPFLGSVTKRGETSKYKEQHRSSRRTDLICVLSTVPPAAQGAVSFNPISRSTRLSLSVHHLELPLQPTLGVLPDPQTESSRLSHTLHVDIVEGQIIRVELEEHLSALPGLQRDPLEAL
jgi:hypothetical protein